MTFRTPPLFLCAVLVAAAPLPAAPATSTTTRPAITARVATRILLIQPNFNFSTDDFYIAAKERERPKLTVHGGGAAPASATAAAAAAAAAASDDELGNWLFVNLNGNELELTVKLPQTVPPLAAEIADDLVEFTRACIAREYQEARNNSLERAQREFDLAQAKADDANRQLKHIREQLRDLSGRSDVSPKTLNGALSSMDDELQRLQIERLSKDARRQALEEQIAELTARVQKRIDSDPIATELKKVVEAREEGVATLKKMYESGTSSRAELTQAVAQAAEAKAKLLQQQRDASAAAGGTSLEAFNRELMTLSIDAKELDTKSKYLEDRLPRLRQAVELLDEYTRIDQRAKEVNASLDVVSRNLQDARAMNQVNNPPKVLVKESKNEREG
jgi:hypothetical protein